MAGCRIVNQNVADAVSTISTTSQSYKTAGEDFIDALNNAISEMEGEIKDALSNFINNDVKTYVVTDLSDAVKGMSDLLEANRKNFEDIDKQIADSISGS